MRGSLVAVSLIALASACAKSDPAPAAGPVAPTADAEASKVAPAAAAPAAPPDAAPAPAVAPTPPDAGPTHAELEAESIRYADGLFSDGPEGTGAPPQRKPGSTLEDQLAEVKAKGPAGKVTVGVTASAETTLTEAAVRHKVERVYLAGLRRCYKDELTRDATSQGTLSITLTVDATGRNVGDGSPRGMSKQVHSCVGSQLVNWRFPQPADADGEPTTASFQLTVTFAPATP